ncbi:MULTISPECIES: TonB-dependent receptor [unclassified Novosphingobium]|uniref:TonB-dependent receptor plug domain-containing protein n=1 Tax=unclassified Novosphingobium TaxID=2644732 RepID=UPI0025EE4B4C|nr:MULTISPECIES: TonB-dependent receptor [unclassified Novosphingobium]HQV03240.1 TonB-dependent receptor [Novosphingobium sp.]
MPAQAQDAPAEDEAGPTIIVTGTRAASRTVEKSPVPVDVLTSDAITEGGQVETNKILNKLVPSFNFPQPAIADGSDALRPATLRGLGPDQTLVLVNGKRRHVSALLNINGTVGRGSAAVDMNAIPALAIDRIEVLRDGASSQYGSDAIAGVINIRLKTTSEGGRAAISYGKYHTTIDGVDNVTGLVTSGGQPQLMTTDSRYFQATVEGERKARDGESYAIATNIGLPFFGVEGGYINLTAEYRHRGYTNRQGFDLRPNYIRPTATTWDPRELTFNRLEFRFGDPEADDFILFGNMAVPVSDSLELYSFASFNQRDSLSAANYRQQNAAANRDWSVLAPNTSPTTANFVGLTADGFLPFIQSDLSDVAVTAGLRTTAGTWNIDGSFSFGRNAFDYRVENSLNTSFGPASQRSFDAGGLSYKQTMANLDVNREFDVGFAKPLTLAFGAEYRAERFQIRPGELQSWAIGPYFRASYVTTAGDCTAQSGVFNVGTSTCSFPGRGAGAGAQGFPGIPASSLTNVKRENVAGYVELDTDIAEGLSTTAAARYEHYSDFGDTLTAKFAARYEFSPGFAVRGSVSNGFRAPSLHQQYFTTTSTNFIGGLPVDISTVAVNSPVARALGSKDLKPEKSLNFSAGFTANPFNGLTFTIDYYNIRINDRIVLTENLGAAGSGTAAVNAAVKTVLDTNGFQSVGAARFFINGLDTRTQGVDAVLNWRLPFEGMGKWTFTAAYNYNKQSIIKYKNDLGPLASIPNLILFGRVESIRFTEGQPRDKVVLSLDGDLGKFGINARTTRYGKVTSPGSASPLAPNAASLTAYGPDDIFLGAKWITDLELQFKPTEAISFAIGADNVFDVYPDRSPWGLRPATIGGSYPANQQYIPFSIFSPFGFNGRYLYARVAVDF